MDRADFLKKFTEFYGEETTHINQISKVTFNGEELLEFINFCSEPPKVHYLAKIAALETPHAIDYRLVIAPNDSEAYDKTVDYISRVSPGRFSVDITPPIV